MSIDAAFTPERIEALRQVDLRLFGTVHGHLEQVDGKYRVVGCEDKDYDGLLAATNELTAARGDAAAIEPTGFMTLEGEGELTIAKVLSAEIPEGPVSGMSPELRKDIAESLEVGREQRIINNLVYAATHTMLREVTVYRADVSLEDWEALRALLPELAPEEHHHELKRYYRNTKMLAWIGDIAIGMVARMQNETDRTDGDRPALLHVTGSLHTPRTGKRLRAQRIPFTSNIPDM